MVLCEIQHVTVRYGETTVLDNVSYAVNEGDFIVIAGATGSGKSTLLRLWQHDLWQHDVLHGAQIEGARFFERQPLEYIQKARISYIAQNPHEQLVMEKVWQELAFPLENMQLSQTDMEQRIAEVLQYLGISHLFDADVSSLSGGQKQLVHLAVALIQRPTLLLLDEPTAQLDPLTATQFIELLARVHRELGLTILMVEHRLEELLPHCNQMLIMHAGQLLHNGETRTVLQQLKHSSLLVACGAAAYVSTHLQWPLALTVKEARDTFPSVDVKAVVRQQPLAACTLDAQSLYFRYTRKGVDVLNGASLQLYAQQALAIVGSNGSGKSTLLQVLASLQKAYKGRILLQQKERVAYLTQNPIAFFTKLTVLDELRTVAATATEGFQARLDDIVEQLQLSAMLQQSPFALSGGQQQLVAFAKIYCLGAAVVLLDEPTKGLDPEAKMRLGEAIVRLQQQASVLFVTHDVDFAATYASHCAMLFQGRLTPVQDVHTFFMNNRFYTTSARRISVGKVDDVITPQQLRTIYEKQGAVLHA